MGIKMLAFIKATLIIVAFKVIQATLNFAWFFALYFQSNINIKTTREKNESNRILLKRLLFVSQLT